MAKGMKDVGLHCMQVIAQVTQSQYALDLLLPQGDYAGALDIMSDIQVSAQFLTTRNDLHHHTAHAWPWLFQQSNCLCQVASPPPPSPVLSLAHVRFLTQRLQCSMEAATGKCASN